MNLDAFLDAFLDALKAVDKEAWEFLVENRRFLDWEMIEDVFFE